MPYRAAVITDKLPQADGLILVVFFGYKEALWTKTGRGVMKEHICTICQGQIIKGELAYRPTGNTMYRYRRICMQCAEDG